MKKRQLIMDCDPGRDDAIAIMMLGRDCDYELLGITTVAGNHTVDHTWNNTQRLCAYLDIPVGVYRGCEGPLLREPVIAPENPWKDRSGWLFFRKTAGNHRKRTCSQLSDPHAS